MATTDPGESAVSVTDLHESKRAILARLYEGDEEGLTAAEIATPLSDQSTENVNYHCRENLAPRGWVEHVGTRDLGYPISANVWALTDDGERIARECSELPAADDLRQRVRELEARVDKHDDRLEIVKETINDVVDHINPSD